MKFWITTPLIFYMSFAASSAYAKVSCLIGNCENGVAYQIQEAKFVSNETLYVGDFKDGKKSGCASVLKGNVEYFGQVLGGKKHGEGKEVNANKMTVRIGTWKKDRFVKSKDSLDRDKLCGSIASH